MLPNETIQLADDDCLREIIIRSVIERTRDHGTHPITAFAVVLGCAIETGLSAGASLEDLLESTRVMWQEVQERKKEAS